MSTPLERVDKLIDDCIKEVGQPPSTVEVMPSTWNWFAHQAINKTDVRIRFDRGRLMYGGIRIKRYWVG
jgi:hypothetical protein